jgi:hypothetical protein
MTMRERRSLLRASAWVLPALLILAAPAAYAATVNVTYNWTAPTSGSTVVNYVVQKSESGGTWTQVGTATSTSYVLAATAGVPVQIRVAGVDAQTRQGVWSVASDSYTPDAGAPGQPGKPVVIP